VSLTKRAAASCVRLLRFASVWKREDQGCGDPLRGSAWPKVCWQRPRRGPRKSKQSEQAAQESFIQFGRLGSGRFLTAPMKTCAKEIKDGEI
jgi:hypothetical protein